MQIQHTKNLIPGRFELGTTLSYGLKSNNTILKCMHPEPVASVIHEVQD